MKHYQIVLTAEGEHRNCGAGPAPTAQSEAVADVGKYGKPVLGGCADAVLAAFPFSQGERHAVGNDKLVFEVFLGADSKFPLRKVTVIQWNEQFPVIHALSVAGNAEHFVTADHRDIDRYEGCRGSLCNLLHTADDGARISCGRAALP